MIKIPEHIYEQELLDWIYKAQGTDSSKEEQPDYYFLIKICKVQFYEDFAREGWPYIKNFTLDDEEKQKVSIYSGSENLQIKAICYDIQQRYTKDKRELLKEASKFYIQLFEETSSPWFILRAIEVRSLKVLKDIEFVSCIAKLLEGKIYAKWIYEIVKRLRKSYSNEELAAMRSVVENRLSNISDDKHDDEERYYIDALFEIGAVSSSDRDFQKSISFERELDFMNSQREGTTYLPNAVDIAQNALTLISRVKNEHVNDYVRIRQKLIEEEKRLREVMMKISPIKYELSESFVNYVIDTVNDLRIDSYVDLMQYLCSIEWSDSTLFKKISQKIYQKSPLVYSSFDSVRTGDKGEVLGRANKEDALNIESHRIVRLHKNFLILNLFDKYFENATKIDEPLFIDEICNYPETPNCIGDNMLFWAHGFLNGLKNLFIESTHILVPQIESYLVKKAEEYVGSLIKYDNENHQDRADLSFALRELRTYFRDVSFYDELTFYFTTGADANIRNDLAHGLLHPTQCMKEGPYVYWIAVKLFFCEDELFKSQSDND